MDARHTSTDANPQDDSHRSRRLAVWVVVGSGLAALIFGPAAIGLVRNQLHIGCSTGAPGSEGADTWVCRDGIGYLGVAVAIGGVWLFAVLLGALAAGAIRRDDAARTVLVLLAGVSTAWVLGLTWHGSAELVHDEYAPMSGEEYWRAVVGPAAVAALAGIAVAVVGLSFRGRSIRICCAAAAVGLVIATVLQPGLSINTIPAAGVLAGAAVRVAVPIGSAQTRSSRIFP